MPGPESARLDFDAADVFLKQARAAHQAGDHNLCLAACKMVEVALGLTGRAAPAHLHTAHLAQAGVGSPSAAAAD